MSPAAVDDAGIDDAIDAGARGRDHLRRRLLRLPLGPVERLQELRIGHDELGAAARRVDRRRRVDDVLAVEQPEVTATQAQVHLVAVAERLADGDVHAPFFLGVGDDEPVRIVAAISRPGATAARRSRRRSTAAADEQQRHEESDREDECEKDDGAGHGSPHFSNES